MLSRAELENYRNNLSSMRKRLTSEVSQLRGEAMNGTGGEASGSLSNTPHHLADLANREFEEEVTLGLVENQEKLLGEIDAALDRIDKGAYGVCGHCGQPIAKERLRALPYAGFCIDCARRTENAK